ncbi:hypothetical protein DDI_2466 [Dickeya dianthicola RNS04.9]|nr:hypothetical protein DDI_2466 [Dickeya dianthicola RNS04.9]
MAGSPHLIFCAMKKKLQQKKVTTAKETHRTKRAQQSY